MGFKFKSKYEGTCKLDPTHKWAVGIIIFMDKEKDALCSNEECYKKQGGGPILANVGKKRLSRQESHEESQIVWENAMQDSMTLWPVKMEKKINMQTLEPVEVDINREQRLDQAKLFYQGIIQLMA